MSSMKKLIVFLAVVASFISARAAWAVVDVENPVTVEGMVVGINYTIGSGSIVVEAEIQAESTIYKGKSENSKATTIVTTKRAVARTSILGLEHIEIKPYPVDTYSKLFEINLFVNNAKN